MAATAVKTAAAMAAAAVTATAASSTAATVSKGCGTCSGEKDGEHRDADSLCQGTHFVTSGANTESSIKPIFNTQLQRRRVFRFAVHLLATGGETAPALPVFRMTGKPFLPEPTMITLELGDSANFSVASM